MANNTVAGTTFQGYIETTRDSLLIFEACKRGLLPRVNRRLQEKERQLVQSGAVFCFDENESGTCYLYLYYANKLSLSQLGVL